MLCTISICLVILCLSNDINDILLLFFFGEIFVVSINNVCSLNAGFCIHINMQKELNFLGSIVLQTFFCHLSSPICNWQVVIALEKF